MWNFTQLFRDDKFEITTFQPGTKANRSGNSNMVVMASGDSVFITNSFDLLEEKMCSNKKKFLAGSIVENQTGKYWAEINQFLHEMNIIRNFNSMMDIMICRILNLGFFI
jgi:hypothetical protein